MQVSMFRVVPKLMHNCMWEQEKRLKQLPSKDINKISTIDTFEQKKTKLCVNCML
jgi:hypothetical protein